MHIISLSRLKEFWKKHPDSEGSLQRWYKQTKHARWQSFSELRQSFGSADQVDKLTVFNIGGNKYRLVTYIDYKKPKVYIRHVLTHAEYDKGHWKKDSWNQ